MIRAAAMSCVVAVLCFAGVAAAQEKDGWVNLLAEKDLSKGWTTKGNWKIADDGTLTLTPRSGEKGWRRFDAYIWSKKQYKDFEADFEYKLAPRQKGEEEGNSGFFFHVGDLADPVNKGLEVQIFDSYGSKAKKLNDHDSGGIIPGVPPTKNTSKPAGEWNRMKVKVQNNKVTVELNGEVVNDVSLDQGRLKGRPSTGHIGIQDHGLPFQVRNLKIRELK